MGSTESWRDEMQAAHLYRVMADAEVGTPRETLFRSLADESVEQAAIWAERAREVGHPVPADYLPSPRARLVAWLVTRLGPRRLSGVLVAMKVRGLSVYGGSLLVSDASVASEAGEGDPNADPGLFPIRGLPTHGDEAEGRRHRAVRGGGNLRAAVFGLNDGLVSNAGLILGVAGATGDAGIVLLSGVAGLLAGAFSMAAGEYVSVRSQREVFEYQIALEREELEAYPEEEAGELALIYEARGISKQQARSVADRIVADPERALDTLAREELGLDPEQLGSPRAAAGFSFFAFASGAALPLAPFALVGGPSALTASIALTGAALFAVGATLSLFTGRAAVVSGLRMLAIGGAAGATTYGIGSLLGVTVG